MTVPTGYTAPIEEDDGISFEDFVMRCARAMGACVTMRDDRMDAPIPEAFEPNDYYRRELEKAKARFKELDGMTVKQAKALSDSEWEREDKARLKGLSRARAIRDRYKAMIERVMAWNPPTPDHQGFKDFMLEQLDVSSAYDGTEYYSKRSPKLDGTEWLEREKAAALKNVADYSIEWGKEQARTNSRNEWIRQLRASLKK